MANPFSFNQPNDNGDFNAPRAYAAAVPVGLVDRKTFITKTYLHLLGAIAAFVLIEFALFRSGAAPKIASALMWGGGRGWLLVLMAFMAVSWFGTRVAATAASLAAQYAGLGVYILAEAIVFVPLLYVANEYAPGAIQSAAICTLLGFTGLSCIAIGTGKDFSFLGGMLYWGMIIALVTVVASALFGFTLGTLFSVIMVGLSGAAILYDTSNILRYFPTDRHVAAALQLFASVALMLWYLLRIFMSRR